MENLAQVKLESAAETKQRIMSLCLRQCQSPDDPNLQKIGSYLGDFANNLRSALNYTMRRFAETRLKPALSPGDYRHLEGNQDFPWSDSVAQFDKKPIVAHTKSHCRTVYDFLEGAQPYHKGKEWLRHLMRISNRDKHEIINRVTEPRSGAVAFMDAGGTQLPNPGFFGPDLDRILVKSEPEPRVLQCPCYYYPFGAFAVKGGKWVFFFIPTDQQHLGLTRFLENALKNTTDLIDDFNALI